MVKHGGYHDTKYLLSQSQNDPHVFGLHEETGVPRGSPCKHLRNMTTSGELLAELGLGVKPTGLEVWGCGGPHCPTSPPNQSYTKEVCISVDFSCSGLLCLVNFSSLEPVDGIYPENVLFCLGLQASQWHVHSCDDECGCVLSRVNVSPELWWQ